MLVSNAAKQNYRKRKVPKERTQSHKAQLTAHEKPKIQLSALVICRRGWYASVRHCSM
jgi:hypothetical protein